MNIETYEAPAITVIGGLHELTLDINKDYNPTSDGYSFMNKPINVS